MLNAGDQEPAIPAFLRVTPEEAQRRREWWAAHPPVAVQATWGARAGSQLDLNAALAPMDEAAVDEEQPKRSKKLGRVRADAGKKPGTRSRPKLLKNYDVAADRVAQAILNRDAMTASKYRRLLREMPNDKFGDECRRIIEKDFGSRLGASPGQTSPGIVRSKDVRSRPKVAGRVRVPRDPEAAGAGATRVRAAVTAAKPTHVKAPAATSKPPRAGIGTATGWKASTIVMLRRPEGATIAEAGAPQGWLDKTTSARFSAIRKEYTIESTVEEGRGRVYRIKEAMP